MGSIALLSRKRRTCNVSFLWFWQMNSILHSESFIFHSFITHLVFSLESYNPYLFKSLCSNNTKKIPTASQQDTCVYWLYTAVSNLTTVYSTEHDEYCWRMLGLSRNVPPTSQVMQTWCQDCACSLRRTFVANTSKFSWMLNESAVDNKALRRKVGNIVISVVVVMIFSWNKNLLGYIASYISYSWVLIETTI